MARSIGFARLRVAPLAGIAAGLAFSACGNGGSGSGGNPPGPGGDQAAPLAVIQFPPDGCLTDAAQVSLAIAVTDETGVELVRAGGVTAVLDSDSRWKVTVPLQEGESFVHVATRDTLGNSNSSAARISIRRESALWIEPSAVAFDELAGQALVLDPALRALFRVDLSGVRSVLSSPGVGSGVPFADPRDVDHVASRNAAVVTDGQLDAVVLVDLSTGARTTLSSSSIGGGPGFLDLHGVAVDAPRDRVLVVDEIRSELMAVDLASGERSTVSSDSVGNGPPLIGPRRIGIDVARNRALVTVALSRSILAVDLANGNRSVLSGGTTGAGPAFVTPFDLVVDLFRDRALVADPGAGALFAVDLATGERQILSSPFTVIGPPWLAPSGVALHLGAAPLVVDPSVDALFEVGATSGERVVLSGFTRGSGPPFARPSALATGLAGPERFVVADPDALFTAGVTSGARALLSGATLGAGALFQDLVDVVVARAPNPGITALDAGLPGLVDVDPSTGNRNEISGPGSGGGPPFMRPRGMVTLGFGEVLVLDNPIVGPVAILRVNLATGERLEVPHGSGPELIDPVAVEFHLQLPLLTDFANVLDAELQAIVSVDIVFGNRQQIFQFPFLSGTSTDLVFDGPRNRFLVTAADPPALLVADLGTQATTVLSDATRGAGPAFGRPEALELVSSATLGTIPSTPIAFVLDSLRGSILAVNTSTGERVIRTK